MLQPTPDTATLRGRRQKSVTGLVNRDVVVLRLIRQRHEAHEAVTVWLQEQGYGVGPKRVRRRLSLCASWTPNAR
jgi:hypothetical protein